MSKPPEDDEQPVDWSTGSHAASRAEVARAVADVLAGGRGPAAAVATVIGRSGSAPQVVGARLILLADGTMLGTVGGGAIEAQVLQACRQALRDGKTRRVDAHLVRDLGMCCGGSMEVFVEYLKPEARLILIGAGHVAQALAPMAAAADLDVTVVDDREELLEHPAFARAKTLAYDVDELGVALPDLSQQDFIVIVSRDHARDEQALRALLTRPHAYLGMIGSRRKAHTVLTRVLTRARESHGVTPDTSRLHSPVGLSLGGRTPGEIAVSILAEIVATRHAGDGHAMSCVDDVVQATKKA